MMQRFHVSATGFSLNYLPQYIAQDRGFFAEAGLHLTSAVPAPWMQVLTDIDTGAAAAALGGIWVPALYHGRGRHYRAFCQMSSRCPLVLVARHPAGPFRWAQLADKVVIVSSTGGAGSHVFLSGLLHRAGVETARFVRDLDYDMLLELFLGGLGDYMLVDVPTAQRLVAEGLAHIALDLAQDAPPVPWSVYYAPAAALDAHPDLYARFMTAFQRGLDCLHGQDIAALADLVARLWPDLPTQTVIGWLAHFRAAGMWNTSARIDAEAFANWQEMLARADLIEQPVPYADLVRTPAAEGRPRHAGG